MDGGSYRFSVYDPAKKSGQWARLNEAGHDFTIRTHDAAKDTITLDYQGRTLTLPLHNAKVVGVAVTEPAAGPRAPSAMEAGRRPAAQAGFARGYRAFQPGRGGNQPPPRLA